MYVTRAQYDALVNAFPAWMAGEWVNFDRKWDVGGVTVSGGDLVALGHMLAAIA